MISSNFPQSHLSKKQLECALLEKLKEESNGKERKQMHKTKASNEDEKNSYELDDLYEDQKQIMNYLLKRFFKWTNKKIPSETKLKLALESERHKIEYEVFKLTRMTVRGAAGTGKSVLIKTIVSLAKRLFHNDEVAFVCAPTGSAGHNAGGETNHIMFGINTHNGRGPGDPNQ